MMKCFLAFAAALAVASPAAAQDGEVDYSGFAGLFGGGMTGKKLAKAIAKADAHPLGAPGNPVRVNGPSGQRTYLARLRCDDGQPPQFERAGSMGVGPFGNIVDLYSVRCAARTAEVHMDMYHGKTIENRAVPGFAID